MSEYQGYGGYGGYALNPQAMRMRMAEEAMQNGSSYSPVQSPWQGAARMGNALVGALMMRQMRQGQQNSYNQLGAALKGFMSPGLYGSASTPNAPSPAPDSGFLQAPTPASSPAVAPDMSPPPMIGGGSAPVPSVLGNGASQVAGLGQSAPPFSAEGGLPPPNEVASNGGDLEQLLAGIAHTESRGWKDPYIAQGPTTKTGDHAYGKYQVMGANVPSWTEQALGYAETPSQFLRDPNAQEAVAHQQLGADLAKYGPQGAASKWFTGSPQISNRSDGNMNDAQYVAATTGGMGNVKVADNSPGGGFQYANGPMPGGGGQIDPQALQARMAPFLNIMMDPWGDPMAKEMAEKVYMQGMQMLMPHPIQWKPVPGTNDLQAYDWMENPIPGKVQHGGPMKYANGEVVNGSPVGADWTVTTTPTGQLVEYNKFNGQTRPVQGGSPTFPDLPGVAPPVGGGAAPPGIGPVPGTARQEAPIPALGGNPAGNTPTPPGLAPGVQTGSPVAGNAPLQRGQFVLQPVEGEQYLDNLAKTNPDMQGIIGEARAILRGDMPLPSGQARAPNAQAVLQLVYKANPNFSAPFAEARKKLVTDYNDSSTPNSPGGLILNANSALGHLGNLWKASQAMAPHQVDWAHAPAINRGLNSLWENLPGGPQQTDLATYRANLEPFVQELTKFYEGSGGTEADRQEMANNLSPDTAPSARHAAMVRLAELLQTKLGALQAKWHQGMGPNSPDYPMLDPESQRAIDLITSKEKGDKPHNASVGNAPEMTEEEYNAAPHGTKYRLPGSNKVMVKP